MKLEDVLTGEMLVIFVTLHLTAFLYFFVGLMLNEPKWRKCVLKILNKIPLNNSKLRIKQGSSELIDADNSSGLELQSVVSQRQLGEQDLKEFDELMDDEAIS